MPQRALWVWLLIAGALVFASVFWFGTLQQPLIGSHEFRQTQTALSALFMRPGLAGLLNYETPVVGAPWSIPFEFPLFQWMANQLAKISGLNLSSSGRLLSVLFGLGCLWPAARLMQRFSLSFLGIGIFVALYCTSSIYLFWNRAFLMESTALFFTLISLDYYSQLRQSTTQSISLLSLVFSVSLSLALLVKATTALPALLLMGGDWIWTSKKALGNTRAIHRQLFIGSAMVIAFALLYSWTHHADAVKQLNPIGSQLTSSALRAWNFGPPRQRLDPALWQEVVVQRMLTPLAAAPITALIGAGIWTGNNGVKTFLVACLFLVFAPLLIFSNLHIVHSYYQASNQIFLLMAVAGSASRLLEHPSRKTILRLTVISSLTIIVIANLTDFYARDWWIAQRFSSDKLTIGKLIQKKTSSHSAILVFGDDWSSAFAYHSQRRAFSMPDWSKSSTASAIIDAKKLVGGLPLGAIVSKQPIHSASLDPSCPASQHRLIKRWHLYICRAINDRQP